MGTRRRFVALAVAAVLLWPLASGAQGEKAGQKVIKDPAEYNAYIGALNTQDPAAKAAAMETFVRQYPNSIMKIDALEQAMAAYQQAGNTPKVEESADRIIGIDPNNVRALAIVAYVKRVRATQGDAKAAAESRTAAERGLQALPGWRQPDGISDAEFATLKRHMTGIFNGAAAFSALQAKDYAKARGYYQKAVAANPQDLQDTYQLAIAELEMSPLDVLGFWHVARAMALAQNNAAARQKIEAYGKAKYSKYHGGDDGWDAIVARAAGQTAPPADFARRIKPGS